MQNRIELEPAYILHRRPYSNTSLIVELFTEHYGRVSAVARSARGPKSRYRGKLEIFYPMLVSWVGKGELKTLGAVDFYAKPLDLPGNALLCGFYLNELLMRLLHREDPHQQLFLHYHHCLQQLVTKKTLEELLRIFEKKLLQELGYGFSFNEILLEKYYKYLPDRGFLECEWNDQDTAIFSGRSLLALKNEQLVEKQSLLDCKRLMRLALGFHLGGKPLKTRDLRIVMSQ